MAMNLHPDRETNLILTGGLKGHDVDEYLFTPERNITSRLVCTACFGENLYDPFLVKIVVESQRKHSNNAGQCSDISLL